MIINQILPFLQECIASWQKKRLLSIMALDLFQNPNHGLGSQVPTHLILIKAGEPPFRRGRLLCHQYNIYINILISVHHHFLSNQIHTSFHSLYYVPFYHNDCNIPLSVLCILQWNIFSVNNQIGIENCSIPVLCTLCL